MLATPALIQPATTRRRPWAAVLRPGASPGALRNARVPYTRRAEVRTVVCRSKIDVRAESRSRRTRLATVAADRGSGRSRTLSHRRTFGYCRWRGRALLGGAVRPALGRPSPARTAPRGPRLETGYRAGPSKASVA